MRNYGVLNWVGDYDTINVQQIKQTGSWELTYEIYLNLNLIAIHKWFCGIATNLDCFESI